MADIPVNATISFPNSNLPALEYRSAIIARSAFERLQDATNAPHMTLWVRTDTGRCDWIVFTPNGG